jgi:hypothetical protein
MAFRLDLDLKEVNKWLDNQSHRDVAKKRMITTIKNQTVEKTREALKGHNTTGQLLDSISSVGTATGFTIYSAMYGDIVLEYGRSPGGRPPEEALRQWAMQRLAVSEGESWAVGRALATKIQHEGTLKHRMGGPKEITEIQEHLNKEFIPNELIKLLEAYTE